MAVQHANRVRMIGIAAVATAVAIGARHLFIDSDAVRGFCDYNASVWYCMIRSGASDLFRLKIWGWVILAFTFFALFRPSVARLQVALVASGMGVALYQADQASGAAALLLLYLAVRSPAEKQEGGAA
jgi:hypothetical protein